MDSPFTVAPVTGMGAFDQVFSVEGHDAPDLEQKLDQLVAALVTADEDYVIRGFDVSGAGSGGAWLATVTALQGITQPNAAIEVDVTLAIFCVVEARGRTNDLTQSAPSTGRSLQQRILLRAPTAGRTCYGSRSAGCNDGKRFLALALVLQPSDG